MNFKVDEHRRQALETIAAMGRLAGFTRDTDDDLLAAIMRVAVRHEMVCRNQGRLLILDSDGTPRTLSARNPVSWVPRARASAALYRQAQQCEIPEVALQHFGVWANGRVYLSHGNDELLCWALGNRTFALRCLPGKDGVFVSPSSCHHKWLQDERASGLPLSPGLFDDQSSLLPKRAVGRWTATVQYQVWRSWLALALSGFPGKLPPLVLWANGNADGALLFRLTAAVLGGEPVVARTGFEVPMSERTSVRLVGDNIRVRLSRVPMAYFLGARQRVRLQERCIHLYCSDSRVSASVAEAERAAPMVRAELLRELLAGTKRVHPSLAIEELWRVYMKNSLQRLVPGFTPDKAETIMKWLTIWSPGGVV